jgi:hypothetical protein
MNVFKRSVEIALSMAALSLSLCLTAGYSHAETKDICLPVVEAAAKQLAVFNFPALWTNKATATKVSENDTSDPAQGPMNTYVVTLASRNSSRLGMTPNAYLQVSALPRAEGKGCLVVSVSMTTEE